MALSVLTGKYTSAGEELVGQLWNVACVDLLILELFQPLPISP
ncbi:hypothetical protein B0G57_105157 [Trinickia symbiotica]|nr:hypothetical protein B0G57_105157 [Trinickia symbiotica]